MKKLYLPGALLISLFIFVCTLEVGIRLWAFFANKENSDYASDSYRILALGESTTAKISNQGHAWPERLEKIAQQQGYNFQVYNEAVPATNSSRLVERTPTLIEKYRPHLIISMMGINDLQTIWPKELLLNDQSVFFKSKFFKLLYYFYLKQTRPHYDRDDHYRYGSAPSDLGLNAQTYLERLLKEEFKSPPYQKAIDEIKTLLKNKTLKQQAQFFMYLAFEIEKQNIHIPDVVKKTTELMYMAAEKDSRVSDAGGLALAYSVASGMNDLCRPIVDFSLRDGHYMGEAFLKNLAVCLKNEPEYIKTIFKAAGDKYEYRAGAEISPLYSNYQELKVWTQKSGICLIILGYPNVNMDQKLKDLIKGSEKTVFFLEQKTVFENLLKTYRFEEVFNDNFASDFGHATEIGNDIIAQHVLSFISELKEKNLCHLSQ